MRKHFDVVVTGGGSAGVAAAVASARNGSHTLLVERSARLGGNVANALVHSICGLYRIADGAEPKIANGGFAMEFAGRLLARGGASGPIRMGRLDVLLQEPAAFSQLCCELTACEPYLTVLLGSEIRAAGGDGGRLEWLEVGERGAVSGDVFVDASGDGRMAQLAICGIERVAGPQLQRPAYIFALRGVDDAVLEDERRLHTVRVLARAIQAGRLSAELAGAALRPTCLKGRVRITIDLEAGGAYYDPMDEAALLGLREHGRSLACEFLEFLKSEIPGFERGELSELPERVGVRESGRVGGQYQITGADILCGARFEDAVCVSAWPIEMRATARGPRLEYPEGGAVCEVPLRALLARDVGNVLMAGRCMSSTHEAQAALRVIGTCLATGEAAGVAASMIARHGRPFVGGELPGVAGQIRRVIER